MEKGRGKREKSRSEGRRKPTKEKTNIIKLEHRPRRIPNRLRSSHQPSNRRCPASQPSRKHPPINAMPEPIIVLSSLSLSSSSSFPFHNLHRHPRPVHPPLSRRSIKVRQPNLLLPKDKEIRTHNPHNRRQKHRERGDDGEERRRFIHELPRLDDPCGKESDEGAAADGDIAGEETGEVDPACDGVTADVFEAGL